MVAARRRNRMGRTVSDRLPDGVLAALRELPENSLGRAAVDEIDRLQKLAEAAYGLLLYAPPMSCASCAGQPDDACPCVPKCGHRRRNHEKAKSILDGMRPRA